MKAYTQFLKELPSKKIVFAFGRFQPPTNGHELLVKAVEKLAKEQNAAHIIYASHSQDKTKNPLPVDRKVYYLKRMFPGANFKAAGGTTRTFIEVAKELNKKYKDIIMVAGSDRVPEYKKILEKYNGVEFHFDTVSVVSAGERDPDADNASGMSGTKMREAAKKGDFNLFKKGLPHTLTTVDGKRLMNEIREGMGMEPIKEHVKLATDWLRESYYRGEIYKVGQFVESNGHRFEILDRGSNYLTVVDCNGNTSRKWITDVTLTEDYNVPHQDLPPNSFEASQISYKGYNTKHFDHDPDVFVAFHRTTRLPDADPVAVLNAIKVTDAYLEILKQAMSNDSITDQQHHAFDTYVQKAQEYLAKIGDLQHHVDYINSAVHMFNQVQAQYHMEKDEQMEESMITFKDLMEMKFTSSDKIKVARIIADALGVSDVEKTSNPEQLVNNALRKVRTKPLRAENIAIIKNMLQTAKEAGIEYDAKLVPQKVDEGYDEVQTSDTKLDKHGRKIHARKLRFKNAEKEDLEEGKRGLWDNIHAKRARIKAGSGEKMRKPGSKGAPSAADFKAAANEEVEQIDEISQKLAGSYYGAATKKHIEKVGVKADMYGRIEKDMGKQRKAGVDRAMDRVMGARKTNEETSDHYAEAEKHLSKANDADAKGDKKSFHAHMANHHDSMSEWHDSKGRSASADKHAEKADYHHEKSLSEATAYYNKPSFLSKMSRIAKQERLAREKKEAEAAAAKKKPVKEENELDESMTDSWKKVQSMDKGSVTGGKAEVKKHLDYLHAVHAHHKKYGNDTKKVKDKIESINRSRIAEESDCGCEEDEMKPKIGDTGKLTYSAIKNFLGLQDVHKLEAGELNNPNEISPDPKTTGVPASSSPLRVKHHRMHEEAEEDFSDLEEPKDEDFEDELTSMSEPEHIIDAYDDDEFVIIDPVTGEELDTEGFEDEDTEAKLKEGVIVILEISRMERMRRKQRFARTKSKREVRAQIALRKTSNTATINKRSRRLAISMIKKRMLRKDPSKATMAEKERVERFVQTRKALIDRLARRVSPRIRQIEKARLQHKRAK